MTTAQLVNCKTFFTSFAVVPGRPLEEIEVYSSLGLAIEDSLDMWPEDDHDIIIMDDRGKTRCMLVRGSTDPGLCTVMRYDGRPDETFHCRYVETLEGRVRCEVNRIS